MAMKTPYKYQAGFTLIEITIAIAIAVILGGTAYVQCNGMFTQGATAQLTSVSASLGSLLRTAADRYDTSACTFTTAQKTSVINALTVPQNVTVTPGTGTTYTIGNSVTGTSLVYTHQSCS
jgi:prepilin-type N-terminal cleavage/methylation domain-containing protein